MNSTKRFEFADTIRLLKSQQVWEYETGTREDRRDVPKQAFDALQKPDDFPPIDAAIVSGDRVALAVDPNVPNVTDVVAGVMKALGQTGAGEVDVVLSDEATEITLQGVMDELGSDVRVLRHDPSDRDLLRYLGADESADPVYLNRQLVDADFVLPISCGRPMDTTGSHDITGVFPNFTDSRSRSRHFDRLRSSDGVGKPESPTGIDADEPAWLLGTQVMISVLASNRGTVGQVNAGTPDAIRKRLSPSGRLPDEFPPPAPLVIACLDGDPQQQTWENAARALSAANHYVEPGGTIVLWTALTETPSKLLLENDATHSSLSNHDESIEVNDEEFPAWDPQSMAANTIARVAQEHRILMHADFDPSMVEAMGLGPITSPDELIRLSAEFDGCGVLRAAQFAGTTLALTLA